MAEYLALFGAAFAAATLLPFYSEIAVAGMVLADKPVLPIWAWATAGNTLGALFNYALARYMVSFHDRAWFPFSKERLGSAQRWFNRYGVWSLIMAWAPVGGDALTYVGGLMRVPLGVFLVLVGLGKALRYAVVIWVAQ